MSLSRSEKKDIDISVGTECQLTLCGTESVSRHIVELLHCFAVCSGGRVSPPHALVEVFAHKLAAA